VLKKGLYQDNPQFRLRPSLDDAVDQLFWPPAYRLQMYFGTFGCFIGHMKLAKLLILPDFAFV
jgi:hypothetical protein